MGLAFLFFIAVLTVYLSLIRPELSVVDQKRALVISKEQVFNGQQVAVTQVQKLVSQFQGFSQLQDSVSMAMPTTEDVTSILDEIQAIAKNAQANLVSFVVSPLPFESTKQPLVKRLGSLELDFVVQGSYESIRNFVGFLETNVRVINVTSLEISPATSNGPSDSYILTTKAEAYYQE